MLLCIPDNIPFLHVVYFYMACVQEGMLTLIQQNTCTSAHIHKDRDYAPTQKPSVNVLTWETMVPLYRPNLNISVRVQLPLTLKLALLLTHVCCNDSTLASCPDMDPMMTHGCIGGSTTVDIYVKLTDQCQTNSMPFTVHVNVDALLESAQ